MIKTTKRIFTWMLVCLTVLTALNSVVFASSAQEGEPEGALIRYVIVNKPVLETPDTQEIMVGIGDGDASVENALLSYYNQETGERYEAKAAEILGDFVLFRMEYKEDSLTGTYCPERITYTADGVSYDTTFEEMGIDAAFGVNRTAESTPDAVLLTDEEAAAEEEPLPVVSLDEEGNFIGEETFAQALERVQSETPEASVEEGAGEDVDATRMQSLVVVLDAGHGGSDPGTQGNGIVEKVVNLKIAQYCKAELSEYSGITVYMTRNDDTYLSLAQRAQVAINKRADVFISLHNNSNTSSGPSGANVYYPNSNYNAGVSASGRALAAIIESKLTDLGLASGGIHIRNSENNTTYPDGSLADYYGVIKRCKENGIPALIVEHAFISNAGDAANFLSSDDKLKKLGIADARGIAEYYGLKKGLGFNSILSSGGTTMELTWSTAVGVTGYIIERSTSSTGGFVEVAKIPSAATTSWQDKGLEPGTTYYYRIRTYTGSGSNPKYGKWSSVEFGTTMSKPMIASVKSKSSRKLLISWITANNAGSYEIYRAKKANGNYKKIATLAGVNRINYLDTVKAGKLYYYKIRSVSQVGNSTVYSEYSDAVSGRTAMIPGSVSVRSEGNSTLRVSWKADPNAAGYVIKRSNSANGRFKKIAEVEGGATKYYDDSTVKAEKNYYYQVQAYNRNNGVKGVSGYGNVAGGKSFKKKTTITQIANTSPTTQIVRWKKAKGIDGYLLYRKDSENGEYKKIKKLARGATSFTVSGLTPGMKYSYKIRAIKKMNKKMGYASYSAACDAWTVKPTEITSVQGSSGNKIQISWNPSGGAESYDIYRAESENGVYQKIGSAAGTEAGYMDSGVKMTATYYYKLDTVVKGYQSTSASGLGGAKGGSAIRQTSIVSVQTNGEGGLEIAWEAVSDVTGYQIYRSTKADGPYELVKPDLDAKAVKWVDDSAQPGEIYYYKIALMNQYGGETVYGEQSPAVSGTRAGGPQGELGG